MTAPPRSTPMTPRRSPDDPAPRDHRAPPDHAKALSRLVASATLLGALVLAGCGTSDALVGLHPAPAEQTAAAPLDTEGATAVAARLLAAKDATVEWRRQGRRGGTGRGAHR